MHKPSSPRSMRSRIVAALSWRTFLMKNAHDTPGAAAGEGTAAGGPVPAAAS